MRIEISDKLDIAPQFQDKFNEIIKFAEEKATADQHESLTRCLTQLGNLAHKGKCHVYYDFAPLSFGWTTDTLQGGCIFHGAHDNGGDGSFPTLSVCLEAVNGWSIHT